MTLEEARRLAAQAWVSPSTRESEIDPQLAEQFALILARECNRLENATGIVYWRNRALEAEGIRG